MTEAVLPAASTSPAIEEKRAALSEVFGHEYAKGFDDPVVFIRRTLKSPAVKQFFNREFPMISRTLFTESVYRRRPMFDQSVLDAFSVLVDTKIENILKLLTTQCGRLEVMCKSNGAMVDADYMNPREVLIPIIAGHAKNYIAVLEMLDVAYQYTGAANLNGVINSNARKQTELLCRKAVRAFSAMLRNEIIKLRKESQRMRAAMNAPDEEVTLAEGAHDQAVATFDKAVSDDSVTDSAINVNPADAAGMIDSLAATAAAQKNTKRIKKTEAEAPAPATAS